MSWPPDYKNNVSERLSEVMDDIGVNERLVMKRRRANMLMDNVKKRANGICTMITLSEFYFGSQVEGSTTIGLDSDVDVLLTLNSVNVIQNMTERKYGVANLMMIQNENISPGYCYLQCISPVLPFATTASYIYDDISKYCVIDSRGEILLKNAYITTLGNGMNFTKQCGPAFTVEPTKHGFHAKDIVLSYCCESSPLQASSWLKKQTDCTWPSEDVKESCRNAGCFVVPVGSKESERPEIEWRVSTCLHERHLMFSLNITQLRCYVLMKMIIKTYIKPHIEDVLTSFMCKNVLLFCVADSSYEWHRGSLLSSLHACLLKLKECVAHRNCPHFMIPDNNLLAGRLTDTKRVKLLDIINNLMADDEHLLFSIQIDDLGNRLKKKLNRISHCPNIKSAAEISMQISSDLLFNAANRQNVCIIHILLEIKNESLETVHQYLCKTLPILSSTLGSVMAGLNIKAYTAISDEAFTCLEAGLKSDALSGGLKLASVLYCTGDVERTENILRAFQEQYDMLLVQSVCSCYGTPPLYKPGFMKTSDDHNVDAIKFLVAFCSRFLRCEINCIPYELRYEIWRYYTERRWKMASFGDEDSWMDFIVVDSVPYLYFLQYKVYGQLERRGEQQQALSNLVWNINCMLDISHKETALNLLGQCLEQESKQSEAFECYISSLKHRLRNNAARLLMCIQLFKLRKKYNVI